MKIKWRAKGAYRLVTKKARYKEGPSIQVASSSPKSKQWTYRLAHKKTKKQWAERAAGFQEIHVPPLQILIFWESTTRPRQILFCLETISYIRFPPFFSNSKFTVGLPCDLIPFQLLRLFLFSFCGCPISSFHGGLWNSFLFSRTRSGPWFPAPFSWITSAFFD